jgi:tetrahydromethanopterin S-methyltransferase subunit G
MSNSVERRLDLLESKVEHITPLYRRIPMALVIAVGIQTLGAVWWASDISSTVHSLKKENVSELSVKNYIAEREKAYLEMDNDRHLKISERVTRVEGNFQYIEKSLTRIEKKLMMLGDSTLKK